MVKEITLQEATSLVHDGDTVMVGGFLANGTPKHIVDALAESAVHDLTLICNDTAFIDTGVGKMVAKKQFSKIIASHIGTNKETGRQMNEGETEVELVPQGTLAERIRSAGFGLGGVLTPTGLGTLVAKGKEIINVDGKDYLLEKALGADVALLYAAKADRAGNLVYSGSENNFNNVMASAGKKVVVEVAEIVGIGEINPNEVITPGVFVDYIVKGGEN